LLVERDFDTLRRLLSPPFWIIGLGMGVAWPVLILGHYPDAAQLWLAHFSDRIAARPSQFNGEPLWEYIISPFWQTLPWTPFALIGAWRTARTAIHCSRSAERFLWLWALIPLALVSTATVRNSHYLIYTLPPWSIWSALVLTQSLGRSSDNLNAWRFSVESSGRFLIPLVLGIGWGFAFLFLGHSFDRRGNEWAFYKQAGQRLAPEEPIFLLYDPSDHTYQALSKRLPHDLGIRLFYLRHPASLLWSISELSKSLEEEGSIKVLSRASHEGSLKQLGELKVVLRGPAQRADRAYALYQIDRQAKTKRCLTQQDVAISHE
jgi:hypothetical protein